MSTTKYPEQMDLDFTDSEGAQKVKEPEKVSRPVSPSASNDVFCKLCDEWGPANCPRHGIRSGRR